MIKQLLTIILLLSVSCKDADNFPNTNVDISVPITMPMYINVYSTVWNYNYIDGGIGGIIIVQNLDNQFIAFDRACTFETNSNCIVSGDSINNPILKCETCCNSQFMIYDGSIVEGPANQALKKYNTYFDGVMLYITN